MTTISNDKVVMLKNSIYNTNTIQFSTNLGKSWIDITNWPVSIEANKIKLESNLNLSLNTKGSTQSGKDLYFIIKKNVNLVGKSSIININNIDNYPGFIQNGTITENGYNLDINNLGINSSNSTLYSDDSTGSGWLIHSYSKGKTTIDNCYVCGNIDKKNTGGFIGSNYEKNVVINNSYIYSSIQSDNSDGFYGSNSNTSNKINNSYYANGSWSDLEASSKLKGCPEYNLDGTIRKNGIYWLQNDINNPYLLKNDMNSNLTLNLKISPCSDYSIIKNILLIDNTVIQNEQFFNSVKSDTLGIIYNLNSTSNELVNFLKTNFTQIDRIGFVFNNTNIMSKTFLDNNNFFINEDLTSNKYSSNVELVLWIISTFNIKNIDYLACESLKHENWKNYFNLLNKESNVIVGASNNMTGNVKYGGDWILELTGEDIEQIYWTNEIQNYTGLLGTQLTLTYGPGTLYFQQSGTVIQYQYNSTSGAWTDINLGTDEWPIKITNSNPSGGILTISFYTDITINNTTVGIGINGYFVVNSEKITFEGNSHNITIDTVTNYLGFIKNGSNGVFGYSNTIIQNINLLSNTSTLAGNGGWIGHSNYGHNSTNCEINNCTSNGPISNYNSGGIFGQYAGINNGSVTATNCSSSGEISGVFSGGIYGYYAGSYNNSITTATNCSSTGLISGNGSGGIFGYAAGSNTGSATATNCSSTGIISGNSSGGIFGYYTGYSSGIVTATKCSSTGNINGEKSGGIFGKNVGFTGSIINITNCSSTGNINGNNAGGIFGENSNSITLSNCYTQGIVTGVNSYGIFGNLPGRGSATNCYYNTPGTNPGATFTNCYSYDNNWNDADAISNLDSATTPTYTGTTLINPIGTVWADSDATNSNVPYIFSSNGSSPYTNPNANLQQGQTSQSANVTTGVTYSIIAISNSPPVVPTVYPFITINSTTGAISVSSSGAIPGTYTLYVYQLNDNNLYSVTTFTLIITGSAPCFNKDTQILTNNGYVLIQNLKKGDLIKTVKHGFVPIYNIGQKDIYNPGVKERIKDQLYICTKEKYPELIEDLIITGCHSILVDVFQEGERDKTFEILKDIYITDNKYILPACVDERSLVYEKEGNYTIYHIALENDDYYMNYGIYANGLLVETCSKRYLKELSNMTLIE